MARIPPVTRLTMPPNSSQTALFVGAPVKKREKFEPTESDALIPKTINTMPAATREIPNALFICFLSRSYLLPLLLLMACHIKTPLTRAFELYLWRILQK